MASLAVEVARIGGKPRAIFEQHLRSVIDAISKQFNGEHPDRERSINMLAQCVGGLMLARAVNDDGLSEEILAASHRLLLREIDHRGAH
jgi:TetR/AcrR family transcriptional regulator, transcriptional repressor for nem operon